MTITLADVERARRMLAGVALRTPMLAAPKLSGLTGAEVFVKYENLQVTNSFKDRGAFVKLSAISEEERRRGVIAMSAGNHAVSASAPIKTKRPPQSWRLTVSVALSRISIAVRCVSPYCA